MSLLNHTDSLDLGLNMELYHLKTFVMVAKEEHLTRAAEKLHTSQPAVSAQIKALEEELGLTLFLRTAKGMRLTNEGLKLYQNALAALATIDDFQHQAQRMQKEINGTIKLGLHIDPAYLHLNTLLSKMRQKYIEVEFHLLQRWSWQQPHDIRTSVLDAGFIYRNNDDDGLIITPLERMPIRVVGPIKWQKRINSAGWKEIAQLPWIWSQQDRCIFDQVGTKAFVKRNLQPFKVAVADQEPAIKLLVSSGIGLGFMIEKEALDMAAKGLVCIWAEPLEEIELCFVHAKNRNSDPLIQALLTIIKEIWQLP